MVRPRSTARRSTGAAPRSRWKVIGEVLAPLAALATILTLVLMIWPSGNEPGGPAMPRPEPSSPSQPAGTPAHEPSDVDVGDCLDASSGSRTRCDVEHGHEIFALDDCSDASLITYLGGNPSVDIVRATPQRFELSDGAGYACAVSPPDGAPDDSPAAGVLQAESGDAWRSCIDERTGDQDMSCAEPHTGEWVSLAPQTDAQIDCEELAGSYMDAPPSRFSGRLQVRSSHGPAGPRCFVTVLGGDLLHGSVRDIGVSSLPTS